MAKVISITGKALRQIDKFAEDGLLPSGYTTTKMEKLSGALIITGKSDKAIFQWTKDLRKNQKMICLKFIGSGEIAPVWDVRENDIISVEILKHERMYNLDIDLSIIEDKAE